MRATMTERDEASVHYLPPPKELTPEQEQYWYEQLEIAERKVEYAQRMLGILAVEKGLSD